MHVSFLGSGFRKLSRLIVPAVMALTAPLVAETPWFSVSFMDYKWGEALSNRGAEGGAWAALLAGTTATNGLAGGGAIRLDAPIGTKPKAVFNAVTPAGESVWAMNMRLFTDTLSAFGDPMPADALAFTFVYGEEEGAVDFAGIVDGAWVRLKAPGVTFALDAWYEVRVELHDIGGGRYAGFFLRQPNGDVQMETAAGMKWFAVERALAGAIRQVEIAGRGQFSDFAAARETAEAVAVAATWAGGPTGMWDRAENWSSAHVPAPGERVEISGPVVLTLNGETARVWGLLAEVDAAGKPQILAGQFSTDLALDVRRPRLGRPLTVEAASFAGLAPRFDVKWYRSAAQARADYQMISREHAYAPQADDAEHWIKCVAGDSSGARLEKEFFFSKLPVIYLTTNDGRAPSQQKEEHAGHLYVQGNDEWKSLYDGAMTIKVRGNSTAKQPKKPWKVKLDEKTKMFDIPKSKHWVLLANYFDETNLRNKLAYDFANEIGSLGMRSTWVECVLNGEWQGLYQFCEHVRVEKNRVNVYDWEGVAEDVADRVAAAEAFDQPTTKALEEAMSGNFAWVDTGKVAFNGTTYALGDYVPDFASITNNVSGGYLFQFEYDEWYGEPVHLKILSPASKPTLELHTIYDTPENLQSSARMVAACRSFLQAYADAATSPDSSSPAGLPLAHYADIESLVAYFLVVEMFGNDDARYRSIYAYMDRDGPLYYGPVWDYDYGVGNYQMAYKPEAWLTNYHKASVYKEWADDPWFCTLLWTRYRAARAAFERIVEEGGLIDQYYAFLREPGEVNERKWKHHYGYTGGIYGTGSHPGLKAFFKTRLAWMDRQFIDVPTLMDSLKKGTGSTPSAAPYTPDAIMLPIAFANAPASCVYDGQSLRVSFRLGLANRVTQVAIFANGRKVGEPLAVTASGRIDCIIPAAALTAALGEPNCISLVALDAGGNAVARNFALATVTACKGAMTRPTLDAFGEEVPGIPLEWIRDAAVAVRPSLAWATAAEFAATALETPSPWGKATPLWRDYVAGTNPDPMGEEAEFRITSLIVTNGVPYMTWAPDLGTNRVYTVEGKKRLDDPTEKWSAPLPNDAHFFRIKVSLPP